MQKDSPRWGLPWPGAQTASEAEALGASAFCTGEFADIDAYVATTEMALQTETAMIGTAISYAFTRSPFTHATAARHLHRLAPGRVYLGLGAGTARMNSDWFSVDSSRAAARMGELVGAIRAYLEAENGRPVTFDGEFYRIDADIRAPVFGALEVPIMLGAFNKLMVRTAGRVADGMIGHGIFTDRWWDELVVPELETGARSAGRDPSTLRRWGWLITAIDDDDPETAIAEAKKQIAFYLTVKTYDHLVDKHGWQDEVAAIRSTFRSDPTSIGDHVTDEMLWAIAVCGSSDQAREMIASRRLLPDLAFLSPPSFLVGRRRRAEYAAQSSRFASTEFVNHPR